MTLFVSPRITEPNLNGIIAAGWTYEFFEAGTSTPKTVYSDASLGTAIGTTVTSDASGRFPVIYIEDTYKVVLKDDTDTVIWTTDGLAAGGTGLTSLSPVSYAVAAGESAVTVNTYDPNTNTVLWFLNSNPVFDGTETNATTFTLASAAVKASTLFQLQFNAMDIGTAAASNISASQGNLQTWMDDADDKVSSYVTPEEYGAVGDGVTDDTAAVQAAIDYANTNSLYVLAAKNYLITSITVTCKVVGIVNNRFASGAYTFTSAVGAGVYAVTLDGVYGALETVTVRNTGAGNGIDCQLTSTNTVLKDVSTSTTFTLVNGSGSIGVNYGTDGAPGTQAITCTFEVVNSRDYDICHRMRYYSNSNTYKQLYAFRTDNGADAATAGFLINGRGGTYISCNAESNFDYYIDEQSNAEENTFINFWAEGLLTEINLLGVGSLMINPYGFVGGQNAATHIQINKGPYATVMKKKAVDVGVGDLNGFGSNLIENAEFVNGLGGLNWGTKAVASGNTIFGYDSLSIEDAGPATSVTADHYMGYIDLNVHTWLRGKTLTYACFGKSESGVSMNIRAIVRNAAGSNLQYGTSNIFATTAEIQKVSITVPEVAADSRYLVFRIQASGVTSGTPSKAGEIALPMIFLGNDLQDMAPKHLSDGANNVYGNMTFIGGFPVVPTYTVATVPTAVAGGFIRVSDETGGDTVAFSDGTNWRRVTDNAIVS